LTAPTDDRVPVYDLRAVQVPLGGRQVLGPLDLELTPGSFVGPNGSGKTTLLRTLTGAVRPSAGEILLHGKPLAGYPALQVARLVGVVPQSFNLDFTFTVEEMVEMGRYAHGARGTRDNAPGGAGDPVASALRSTGLTELSKRPVTQLSGGERQRALIAQTLAQETPTLLLDEPLNNLDLNHQLETMQLLRSLHASGRTLVVVLHDLNMAAQYCDELVLIRGAWPLVARRRKCWILG
jgi:iron complex transport system ATP-binding protein